MFKQVGMAFATLFLCSAAFAQSTLQGRVVNKNGEAVANAEVALTRYHDAIKQQANSNGEFTFIDLAPGEYEIKASADGFYAAESEFVVRPRQAVSLTVELTPTIKTQTTVEVKSADISRAETSNARLLTHQELEQLPQPQKRDIPTLALNTFPGATLSHDNFVHVRGNEVSLEENINGVSFLENPRGHFSPGLSPEMFERSEERRVG